jgi:hypothetical protein
MSPDTKALAPGTSAAADPTDVPGLRLQVERTRAELADTVEGLMYHLDVKARGKEKVDEATAKAKAKGEELKDRALKTWHEKPAVVAGAAAGAVVVTVVIVVAVRKGSK